MHSAFAASAGPDAADASALAFYEGQARVLELIARGEPLASALEQLALFVEGRSPGLYCTILLLGEDGVHIQSGVSPRLPATYMKALEGYPIGPQAGSCGTAMHRRELVVVTDILSDPLWAPYKFLIENDGFRACWSLPILSGQNVVLGSFAMYYKEVRQPGPAEMMLLRAAANVAGIAIERDRRDAELHRYRSDLEARVQARTAELEQSLLEQRAIFENTTVAIFMANDRVIVRCNRRMADMLGYTPDELIGQSTRIYFPSDDAWRRFGEQSHGPIVTGQGYVGDTEVVRKDGSRIWCSAHGKAIDPADLSKGTIWVGIDVTDRKHAEAALERAMREQQALFDNANAGIHLVKDRHTVRCNRGLEQMLGYSPGELTGQPTRKLYGTDEEYLRIGREAYGVIDRGEVWAGEIELARKDGKIIVVSVQSRAMDAADPSAGTLWVSHDITARKHAERELLQAKEQLEESLAALRRTHCEVELMSEMSAFLQVCHQADEAVQCIRRFAPRMFPGSAGMIYAVDDAAGLLTGRLAWGERSVHEPVLTPDACWALRRGTPYRVDEPDTHLCCPHVEESGIADAPYVCLPLMAHGETFGLLTIFHPPGRVPVEGGVARHRLAVSLAEQVGLALANISLREQLRRRAPHD